MGEKSTGDKVTAKPKAKRVVIDKKKLKSNLVQKAEKELELPQLNSLMGLGDGEVAVVKIRQLELDEYLALQTDSDDKLRNMIDGIVAAAEKLGEVEDEILAAYKGLSQKGRYYIDICAKGVVEPSLKRTDWMFLARSYPIVIETIAAEIILLTRGGANVKKNSSG